MCFPEDVVGQRLSLYLTDNWYALATQADIECLPHENRVGRASPGRLRFALQAEEERLAEAGGLTDNWYALATQADIECLPHENRVGRASPGRLRFALQAEEERLAEAGGA